MSNETPKISLEKIKSARRQRATVIVFVAILTLATTLVLVLPSRDTQAPYVKLNGTEFTIELADSDEELIRGLSGRSSLADGTGMLFEFTEPAQQCIWMKEMRFSIDIVWLDSSGRVLDIKERVSPDTYPEQFCSSDPATYVLELPAGTLAKHEIAVGNLAKINP